MSYTVTVRDGHGRYGFTFRSLTRALAYATAARRINRAVTLSCEAV